MLKTLNSHFLGDTLNILLISAPLIENKEVASEINNAISTNVEQFDRSVE